MTAKPLPEPRWAGWNTERAFPPIKENVAMKQEYKADTMPLSFAELGEIDTDNLRVRMIRPLRPPACLIEELESDVAVRQQVP